MNTIQTSLYSSPSARRQRGLSLVEIMVALAISLFLMVGVIQLFIGSKQTYRFHDGLSRIQENGRFALDLLARDIRMAGQYGCLPASTAITNVLNTPTAYFWNFEQAIQGFESTGPGAWTPALDASITSPFGGGDVDAITIRGPTGPAAPILAHGGGANDPRVPAGMPAGSTFASCDVVIAASCAAASAFQVTGVAAAAAVVGPPALPAGLNLAHATGGACGGGSPGNAANNLTADFAGGEVARVATKSYYIRTGASGRPALWRRVGPDPPQELVEGVERLEVRYGVCTGAGAARSVDPAIGYVPANDPAVVWADVCSVRIDLLLASLEDNLVTTPQTVVFPADTGINVVPGDRRLRQGFSTTVGIRNRLP